MVIGLRYCLWNSTHDYGYTPFNGEVAELVESTTLLTWQALQGLEGSNPSLSAM